MLKKKKLIVVATVRATNNSMKVKYHMRCIYNTLEQFNNSIIKYIYNNIYMSKYTPVIADEIIT